MRPIFCCSLFVVRCSFFVLGFFAHFTLLTLPDLTSCYYVLKLYYYCYYYCCYYYYGTMTTCYY